MPPVLQTRTHDVTRPVLTGRLPARVGAADVDQIAAELVVTLVAAAFLVPTTCAGALCCNGAPIRVADVAGDVL